MVRQAPEERREQLLNGAIDYVTTNGISGLSLRPLAKALDVNVSVLLHHFGSKEAFVGEIMNGVQSRQGEFLRDLAAQIGPSGVDSIWDRFSDDRHAAAWRVLFECHAFALQRPGNHGDFLDHVVTDWIEELEPRLGRDRATLAVAALRGLMLDLLTTGDRDRVAASVELLRDVL